MQMKLYVAALAHALVLGGAVQLRNQEQFFAYDYSKHGQDWVAGTCTSKSRQSPIDLPTNAPVTGTFTYKYKPVTAPFDLLNNGHTFAADFQGLGYGGLTYNNAWYELMNVNVHSMSEHTWRGVQKPLELHMVHKHYSSDALLIIAVAVEGATPLAKLKSFLQVNQSYSVNSYSNEYNLRKQGIVPAPFAPKYGEPPATDANFNPTIQAFLKTAPPPVNTKVSVPASLAAAFEFNTLVQGAAFYEYAGSLTAPPCAEIATWLVRKDAIKASDKQVLYLHDAIFKTTADFGNNRQLMPLNGRTITMKQSVLEDPPRSGGAAAAAGSGAPMQSDREFRAMKWSMDAMTIAKGATDYVKDLDMRLRNAAQAHAQALSANLEPITPATKSAVPGQPVAQGAPVMGQPQAGQPLSKQQIQMENTAQTMTRAIAEAAREEVASATLVITAKAKEAAINAAREAAMIVDNGQGNSMAMANSVPVTPR